MEPITQDKWIGLPHRWKIQLTMDILNELIPIINKNHQANFKLFELREYPIAVLCYWNEIIDYLNKIHNCTINHLDRASSFYQTFDTLNYMIELENNFEENKFMNKLTHEELKMLHNH